MVVIYANKKIQGLEGRYLNPHYATRPIKGATIVYTDDPRVKLLYKNAKVEFKSFNNVSINEVVTDFIQANTDIEPDAIIGAICGELSLTKAGKLTKASETIVIEAIENYKGEE